MDMIAYNSKEFLKGRNQSKELHYEPSNCQINQSNATLVSKTKNRWDDGSVRNYQRKQWLDSGTYSVIFLLFQGDLFKILIN